MNQCCFLVIIPSLTLSMCVKTSFSNCLMLAASTIRCLCCLFALSLSSVRYSEVPHSLTTQTITSGLCSFNSLFCFQVMGGDFNKNHFQQLKDWDQTFNILFSQFQDSCFFHGAMASKDRAEHNPYHSLA